MSDTKVATSPGAKNVFPRSKLYGSTGGPGNRRFRSCSMSGNAAPTGFRVTSSNEHHRRFSQVHGPSNLTQQYQQQQHKRGGGGGGNCAGIKRRAGSFGGSGDFKRRKKEPGIVPVTKFLLGGNINDPLNLNSFEDDEEANRAINEVTPYSSPLPRHDLQKRVAVLIPPDICDPLNLNGGEGDIELNLVSPNFFKRKRNRKRQKRASSGGDAAAESTVATEPQPTEAARAVGEIRPTTLQVSALSVPIQRTKKIDDKIVSPVIPQPGERKHRPSGHSRPSTDNETGHKRQGRRRKSGDTSNVGAASTIPSAPISSVKSKWRPERFRYGNYDRYYGYRNPNQEPDYRLSCMRREWLEGKDVLDLGCNVGHVTLSLARDFGPRRIVGTDIDPALVGVARKNVSHYLTQESDFPISLAIMFGPIPTAASLYRGEALPTFPNNVFFMQGNYVFESDDELEGVYPEYDTILCLSLTKWIHFNWGDDGLKRFFKRIFRHLRPGGRLILEAQNWPSYSKKKKLLPLFFENYQSIRLRPENFTEYLLSKEVGFSTCEVIDTPFNQAKGFQRPMQLFTKSVSSPSSTPSEALTISQNDASPVKEAASRA